MNEKFDFLKELIPYVEGVCSNFLTKYKLEDEFDVIRTMAEKENKHSGITAFFDVLTNGTVGKVAEKTGLVYEEVKDDFLKTYFK